MTFEERCQKFSDAVALLLTAINGKPCGFTMIIVKPEDDGVQFRVLTNMTPVARIEATQMMLDAWKAAHKSGASNS